MLSSAPSDPYVLVLVGDPILRRRRMGTHRRMARDALGVFGAILPAPQTA